MINKQSSVFNIHDPQVDEIRYYLRWSRRLFVALIGVFIVNSILTYGLIFHPSKPSVTTCAIYCPSIYDHRAAIGDAGAWMENSDSADMLLSAPIESRDLVVRGEETTKDVAERTTTELSEVDPRWNYGDVHVQIALAMGAYYTINQAIQWWNMVSACQDFGESASNAINCLWGAVSTVITASGSLYGAYKGWGHISTWLSNNGISIGGFKREEIPQGLLDEFSTVFGSDVSHIGMWDYSSLNIKEGLLSTRDTSAPLPVFGFNSNGQDVHFSYLGNSTNGPQFKFGFGVPITSDKLKSRTETWDSQYFLSGGIDFVLTENPDSYTYNQGALTTGGGDYTWIYDQVSCIMASSMTAAGHYFQIYDNAHQGTLAAGAIAPFRGSDHWSAITQMEGLEGGLTVNPSCDQSKRSVEFES